jgi:hypothetical protein
MESADWMNWIAGGLAIAIFISGVLRMFTNIWNNKKTK